MGYAAAAGLILGAGGAFLEGRSNDIARNRLENAAEMPGVDTGALTEEALRDQLKYLPQGTELADKISTENQRILQKQEEAALPGVGAARSKALGRISSLFDEDSQWLQGVQRRGAALGLSSGLFGSQAGQLRTLRLGDQESQARTQLGTGLLGSLIGSMRLASSPGVQSFLGPNPNQLIGIRSQERAARQQLMAQAAGIGGQTAAWGKYLNNVGGALLGGGMIGGGGGGGGMPSGSQQSMMLQDYSGASNMGASYF